MFFNADICRMYSSGKYSDLIIHCQGKTFSVHHSVVCLQSKIISRMVDGEFMVSFSPSHTFTRH